MDRLLGMVRATGLRSVRVGSEVGVGLLATGECDGDGRVFFRIFVSLFQVGESLFSYNDFPICWWWDLVQYNTFVEEQY